MLNTQITLEKMYKRFFRIYSKITHYIVSQVPYQVLMKKIKQEEELQSTGD